MAEEKLKEIHSKLQLMFGSLDDELPEQTMSVMFIQPNSVVLEIGGNWGRNSCVIGSILSDSTKLVVLESDPKSAEILRVNRDYNNLKFHIEPSALSKIRLAQCGWDTKPYDILEDGWTPINTLSWNELTNKYPLPFDTLVADCEGALYYILLDEPELLNQFKTVILENDYHDINHKRYVNLLLITNGFRCVYSKSGGWGCCQNFFFETWCK